VIYYEKEHAMNDEKVKNTGESTVELSPEELDQVNGGTKVVDASSPTLFQACATGKHINKATISS